MSSPHRSDAEESKTCPRCGRTFEWRRKWRDDWEQVRYCSQRCRRTPLGEVDRQLEESILRLLSERSAAATICPSEAARVADPGGWRELMQRTRAAARRLCAEERVEIRQKGRRVDASTAKGAIRLARGRRFGEGTRE
ncbi:MAG: DUF2256 and DUF3253 domain-containing protein [Acidobacteria bacterium]|nr:MAG: DUF2256 and DUF3253 domain-containing protein [Acidobacteriota bacterium]REK11056.1 MAG: DUF2256 and DUF3253 domain-containing protein [Acidobacteriota bacterium]